MRILNIFNHYLEPGGEAWAVDAICASLSEIHDLRRCEFFSSGWTGADAPAKWKQALWMFRNPKSLDELRRCEQLGRSDLWLVHNILPVGSLAVYPEAQRQDVPIVQYVHNFRPFSVSGYLWANNKVATGGLSKNYWSEIRHGAWQNSRAKTALLALALTMGHALGYWRNVRAWIAISEFMRARFVAAGVPSHKIFTLRHFWNPRPTGNGSGGRGYVFLGRLVEAKGVNVLLDAWQILERRYGPSTPPLLIGGDGPLRSVVISRAERMQAVTFGGQISGSAKQEALKGSRAVIVPSISWEALGLTVYEAYDYSRPVLVANSGGLGEVVVEGKTGFVHQPGNADELAEHVMKMENEPARARDMGRCGRSWLEVNASELQWRKGFAAIAEYAVRADSPR
jgi:glycosyltransferase involved in cell wall biosynthesis